MKAGAVAAERWGAVLLLKAGAVAAERWEAELLLEVVRRVWEAASLLEVVRRVELQQQLQVVQVQRVVVLVIRPPPRPLEVRGRVQERIRRWGGRAARRD